MRAAWHQILVATAALAVPGGRLHGMPPTATQLFPALGPLAWQETDDDSQEEIIERYLVILEKNPRRGTALDRVYGHYVEGGKLEELVGRYEKRTADSPNDHAAWMVLGLIESKRGRDAQAIRAFQNAETCAPDNPLASHYLGQSLVLAGRCDEAVEALERAAGRKPQPADLLDIFQTLGRLHHRAGRNEEAIAAWKRLEALFPDDVRVQELIAATLAEEQQHEAALKRFEALASKAGGDPYQQVRYRIEAADIKLRLGRKRAAIEDFEGLLERLEPDSWLFRQVRRRIEDSFHRDGDLSGLADYYGQWIGRHPEDVDAMSRLAGALAAQGRSAEAQSWLDRAVRLAPKRAELRLALIEQLAGQGKYREAVEQYAALDKIDENNPDYLRQWGLLILKDKSLPQSDRRRRAGEVWRRLVAARPDDPVALVQAADLMRRAEMTDEALALYRQAVDLEPDEPQYREYLGQYYHSLGRRPEAIAAWQGMAEGSRRSGDSLHRLAEVLSGFGYLEEALRASVEACRLDPDDFDKNRKCADLLLRAERYDDSLARLEVARRAAAGTAQLQAVLDRQIQIYQETGRLGEQIERLRAELEAGREPTAQRWRRLARYLEAARRLPEATRAVREALRLDDRSTASWRLAAIIYERAGGLAEAADAYRKLAALDRAGRTQCLREVARLETQLGRADEALRAGREAMAAAPASAEHHQFFAELCFRLGQIDEGLEALRRAARADPAQLEHLLTLADALAKQFQTDEAIELYWQAFGKSRGLEDKLTVTGRLTDLYLQTNRLDALLERLERLRRQVDLRREMTFCLARAHLEAQDFAGAREELEKLLAEDDRDTHLVAQLSSLAEQDGDVAAAIRYELRLGQIAPERHSKSRLAELYLRAGKPEQAEALWAEMAMEEDDPRRLLASVDNLLSRGRYETALSVTARVLQLEPDNWEMMYRAGVALEYLGERQRARRQFDQILKIPQPLPATGAVVKGLTTPGSAQPTRQIPSPPQSPWRSFPYALMGIQSVVGPHGIAYVSGIFPQAWTPSDLTQARMASIAWLWKLAQEDGTEQQLVARFDKPLLEKQDQRALWDAFYFELVRNRPDRFCRLAKELSRAGGPGTQQLYLDMLAWRGGVLPSVSRSRSSDDKTPPLDDDDLEHMLACYRGICAQEPDRLDQRVLDTVFKELQRAKRDEQVEEVYRRALQTARQPSAVVGLMSRAAMQGNVDDLVTLLERLRSAGGTSGQVRSLWQVVVEIAPLAAQSLAPMKAHADVLRLLEEYQRLAPPTQQRRSTPIGLYAGASGTGSPSPIPRVTTVRTGAARGRLQIPHDPEPNEYYDTGALMLLRVAMDFHKRDGALDQLFSHFENRASEASGNERLRAVLALSYLHRWTGDQTSSAEYLEQAVALSPRSADLLFDLSQLESRLGDPAAALSTLERIEVVDQQMLRRRENSALYLAQAAGDTERARKAGERLFGMRLDAEDQVRLASQIRPLGMDEMAEALLRRARRRSGGDQQSLTAVMNEYLKQGNTDLAVQVAHQILRRHSPATLAARYGSSRSSRSSPREEAMKVLTQSGKLDELIEQTEAQWKGSPSSVELMQTLIDYYEAAKQPEKAKPILESLVADRDRPFPPEIVVSIGRALEDHATLRPLVIEAYEKAAERVLAQSTTPFSQAVVQQLFNLYRRSRARREDARELLLKCFDRMSTGVQRGHLLAQRLRDQMMIAQHLHSLGYPLDAFRLYRDMAEDRTSLQAAGSFGTQIGQVLEVSMDQVRREIHVQALVARLPEILQSGLGGEPRRPETPIIDLMIHVRSRELDRTAIASPVADALKVAGESPQSRAQTRAQIDRLTVDHPRDFSVMVTSAVFAAGCGDAESKRQAMMRLVKLAEENPLLARESETARATRAPPEVVQRLSLWLAAREAIKDDALRPLGEKLAAEALEAARRHPDSAMTMAILRELAQAALERDDRRAADGYWRQLLAELVRRDRAPDKTQGTESMPPEPITASTFLQLVKLAKMAVAYQMPELSLDAVREGLQAGPPRSGSLQPAETPSSVTVFPMLSGYQRIYTSSGQVVVIPAGAVIRSGSRSVTVSTSRSVSRSSEAPSVEEAITQLDDLWRQHGISSEKAYETLLAAVLPERRPDEVFLYTRRITDSDLMEPHSVGLLLVRRAVEAGRADDLRKRLASRLERPSAELPARVLQLQLGAAAADSDLASEAVEWLIECLRRDNDNQTARLACHAVMPMLQKRLSFERPSRVLELAAANLAREPGDSLASSLRMALLLAAFQCGDADEGIRQLLAYRQASGGVIVRANSSRQHKLQMMEIGVAMARSGQLAAALAVLGDFTAKPYIVGRGQTVWSLIDPILRQMATRSSGERYELLRPWILPSEGRPGVRQLAVFTPSQLPPEVFLREAGRPLPAPGTVVAREILPVPGGVMSFTELLIEAARESGRLDELLTQVRQAAEEGAEGADGLLTCVLIAAGQREAARPQVEKILKELSEYLASGGGYRRLLQWSHYLTARACMADEQLRELGEELTETLLEQSRRLRDVPFRSHLLLEVENSRARGGVGRGLAGGRDPGLVLWHPAGHQDAAMSQAGTPPASWTAGDGNVRHLCGPQMDFLYFKYPLAGSFEFSVECYAAPGKDAGVAYGGIVFEPLEIGEAARLWTVGGHDLLKQSDPSPSPNQFNRLTVQVRPDAVRYLCNRDIVWEDKAPSCTSPWVALFARGDRSAAWRNLEISGSPTIPREVSLTCAARMEGWTARHFAGPGHHRPPLPKRLGRAESSSKTAALPKVDPQEYEWSAWEGAIHGRRVNADVAAGPVQSWLAYHRPMQSGERVSYEFLYKPGEVMVHPAVGRVAMLLEPGGVRLHWITDSRRDPANGLPADNAVEVLPERRGPKPLPLKPGAWNSAALSLDGDVIKLKLNGELVYERLLEPSNRRLFGLFHYSDRTAAQARNVVLQGDWPDSLSDEQRADLTARR